MGDCSGDDSKHHRKNKTYDLSKVQKIDSFIFKVFPKFVPAMFILSLVIDFTRWDHLTLGHFMYSLSLSYVFGFTLLGIPVLILSERRFVRTVVVAAVMVLFSTAYAVIGWEDFIILDVDLHNFMKGFFWYVEFLGLGDSLVTFILGVYAFGAVIVFATYGVLGVVSSYFRVNYHRILLSMKKNDDSKLCTRSKKLFLVPDIIDVDDVELHPEPFYAERFSLNAFKSIMAYEIVIGVIVSSYLFLNPVFLGSIPAPEMVAILMMLSFFVCTLIIPVSVIRSLGAEAHSKGNRPFVLWKGMKNKLFHLPFYICLFLTLLWVSLYIGIDGFTILENYTGFVAFMILLGAVVAFVYLNTFHVPLMDGIIARFNEENKP